jgi:choline dehydrogenase
VCSCAKSAALYAYPVGTCRIGAEDIAIVGTDPTATRAVGPQVPYASVMPSIPCAITNATMYTLANRAAELIAQVCFRPT